MLGCHDFCGYYDWTFHYLRRRFGEDALKQYWREAIAADSQRHYLQAAGEKGLAGLQACWETTGESEQCDWTVSLDEAEEILRLDMRECPSKGFLLEHDRNADEDYCDHCIGWIGPALESVGLEVIAHEHNHCGQCWWQIGPQGAAAPSVMHPCDARQLPSWQHGYLHRFERHEPVADGESHGARDATTAIAQAVADSERLLVIGSSFDAERDRCLLDDATPAICVAACFEAIASRGYLPRIVVASSQPMDWQALGVSWNRWCTKDRPLLIHDYLPGQSPRAWSTYRLPRPLPLLPTLIRAGCYRHQPGSSPLTADAWSLLLAQALGKEVTAIPKESSLGPRC